MVGSCCETRSFSETPASRKRVLSRASLSCCARTSFTSPRLVPSLGRIASNLSAIPAPLAPAPYTDGKPVAAPSPLARPCSCYGRPDTPPRRRLRRGVERRQLHHRAVNVAPVVQEERGPHRVFEDLTANYPARSRRHARGRPGKRGPQADLRYSAPVPRQHPLPGTARSPRGSTQRPEGAASPSKPRAPKRLRERSCQRDPFPADPASVPPPRAIPSTSLRKRRRRFRKRG